MAVDYIGQWREMACALMIMFILFSPPREATVIPKQRCSRNHREKDRIRLRFSVTLSGTLRYPTVGGCYEDAASVECFVHMHSICGVLACMIGMFLGCSQNR